MTPDLTTTISLIAGAFVIGGFANWQQRRPFDQRVLRLIPWLAVQFLAAVVAIVMAAHLVSLVTGHDLQSRYGY